MAKLRQFYLLLWKNFILQIRRPFATFVELALPLLFSALLVVIRTTVETTNYPNTTTWSSFGVNSLPSFKPGVLPIDGTFKVGFVPDDDPTVVNIMDNFKSFFQHGKSDLEVACPGVTYLLNPETMEEFGPGGLARFSDYLGNDNDAFARINQFFGRNMSRNAASALMVNAILANLPDPVMNYINKEAFHEGIDAVDYVGGMLMDLGPEAFMREIFERFVNSTIECVSEQMGQSAPVMMNMNRTAFNVNRLMGGNSSMANSSDDILRSTLGLIPKIEVVGFADEDSFMEFVSNDTHLAETLGGVIFSKYRNGSRAEFSYEIRLHADPVNIDPSEGAQFTGDPDTWRTTKLFPLLQTPGPRNKDDKYGGKPGYYKEGFLSLMRAVDMSILATLSDIPIEDLAKENFHLKRFPYPPYVEDNFLLAISQILPLLLMLSFFYTALVIVKSVVHEKETKLKEYLMMTGLSNWLHWLAWFIKYMIFLSISCVLISVLYKIPTNRGMVFTYSHGTIIFVYLLAYSAATICFCFMVSVFFKKANVAAAAGGVLFGLSYMPYMFISQRYEQMSWAAKAVSCLLSNVAMSNGAMVLSMYEGKGVGVQWWNINEAVSVDDNFTFLQAIIFLIVDAVLYMTIAWYVEGVRPGEYGIPKPWYFPFTKTYWCGPTVTTAVWEAVANGSSEMLNPSHGINGFDKIGDDSEFFESETPGMRRIVEICGLRKVFNPGVKEKVAVDSLNLSMYEGQITVLLGHNGAGKTTTMSMLTGLYPPTSGYATIMGHNITTNIDFARKSMGLCPQHDILFDRLTVDEHLYFFSRLKGLSRKEAKKEREKMCHVLQLSDKHKALASTLSGGMKRKLSVGIALCAGSKFIVLDEPTAGMDPAARRAIWDLLQHYRSQCSMLLSTHFMDEADLLGDRIAIMADGKLRCAGSSVFLKNKFGVGYHVVLNKSQECDLNKLTTFFRSHVPESRMERTSGAEVSYLLPFESSNMFQHLFTELDNAMTALGVLSYGASITTMEEVFLCVTEDVMKPVTVVSRRLSLTGSDDKPLNVSPSRQSADILQPPDLPNSGMTLWFQQFFALLIKRILHSVRHLKVIISQMLVPVVFVIIAILNAKFSPFLERNRNLNLTLDGYGVTNVSYNLSSDVGQLGGFYSRQFSGLANAINVEGDLEAYLSDEYAYQGGGFNSRNVIGATLRSGSDPKNSTIAWFNAQAYHSSANSLLYADQAFIRERLNNSHFSLDVSNYPLPRNSSARVQEQLVGSISGFMIAFNVVMGFSFLAASFSIFIVRERTDRASLLQTLAGVDPFCFWLSGFTWDLINFLIPCVLCMIVFAAFGIKEYIHNGQFWITLFLLILYCWSALPLTYIMSLLFTLPTTALVSITIFGAIMGLATIITINILMIIDDHTRAIGNTLDWVFLALPQYCIGQGLADLYTNDKMVNICTSDPLLEIICKNNGIDFQTNFMSWERYGVGRYAFFMALEGLIFFAMLFAVEYDIQGLFLRLRKRCREKTSVSLSEQSEPLMMDEDVIKEQNRINDALRHELVGTDLIYAKKLRKVFKGKKGNRVKSLVAVEDLCVGVQRGECFGLLGINGAGKTTTFKMLTGDLRPSSGTAFVSGQDIVSSRKLAQQNIGYCPQFDGLIEQMTGWETLVMYARLRGIKEKYISKLVQNLARLLNFEEHISKVCGKYSGGNKRKLSTAIALIGGPPVVLLDEPSTGMDPGARRKLWNTISQICNEKRCIIITSHSMEECEALCTRLAIMVNGQLRCLGGPQHLKTKFGQGYSVEVKLANSENDPEEVKSFMHANFPGTVVKDEHQGLVAFQVPKTRPTGEALSLAIIFGRMEEAKRLFDLRDYSVSQTTLEQVFLSFARRQREAEEP